MTGCFLLVFSPFIALYGFFVWLCFASGAWPIGLLLLGFGAFLLITMLDA